MKQKFLSSVVAFSLGLGLTVAAHALEPAAGKKTAHVDGISKADKPGTEGMKGGKDKLGGAAMMKDGGDKGGKDGGGKGGKDKLGAAMMKDGGDKGGKDGGGKGGKDKLGATMMKEGSPAMSKENLGKGGKDKMMSAPAAGSQMREVQSTRDAMGR